LGHRRHSKEKGDVEPLCPDSHLRRTTWVSSREEVAELLEHHFGLLRYEFHIFRSSSEAFTILFSERAARDLVFARGRISDRPIELSFHSWEVDQFRERTNMPYHVKLSIEGLPHHVWFPDIADRVVGDEALIHHVE
jgi:hypothetical protein